MLDSTIAITENAITNIYLIGYKNQGESIVVEIKDKNINPAICGIIDCFKYQQLNWTLKLLRKEKINSIQFLFWSHPDEDHSRGLDDILEKYQNNIKYIGISEGLSLNEIFNSIPRNTKNRNLYMKKIFDNIKIFTDQENPNFIRCNADTREFKIPFLMNNKKVNFTIKPFAPLSSICNNENIKVFDNIINKGTHSIIKNRISSGLLICIGDRKLCLTGDIINESLGSKTYQLKLMNMFKDIDIVKIPHHGSKSSSNFIDLLPKNILIAGVTKYKKEAPDQNILKRYKARNAKIYATSHINPLNNIERYGIVKITIPLDSTLPISCNFIGNACDLTSVV